MMNTTTSLIGLGIYFGGLFVFGLLWKKHEAAQRDKAYFQRQTSRQEDRERAKEAEKKEFAAYADAHPEIS